MSEFDPYHLWLGIPPQEQPPNHYRLLGITVYEGNPEVIDAAANRQASYLNSLSAGKHRQASQQLLNEVAGARRCLLNLETKATYDQGLRDKQPVLAASTAYNPLEFLASELTHSTDVRPPAAEPKSRDPKPRGKPEAPPPAARKAATVVAPSKPKQRSLAMSFVRGIVGGGLFFSLFAYLFMNWTKPPAKPKPNATNQPTTNKRPDPSDKGKAKSSSDPWPDKTFVEPPPVIGKKKD